MEKEGRDEGILGHYWWWAAVVAIQSLGFRPDASWLDSESLHRIQGIVIYFGALWLAHASARALVGGRRRSLPVWPLIAYFSMALLVPLLNGAWLPDPNRFLHHAAWVAGVPIAMVLASLLVRSGTRWTSP